MSDKVSGSLLGLGSELYDLFDDLNGIAMEQGVPGPTYPSSGAISRGSIAKASDFNLLATSTRRIRDSAFSTQIAASSFEPGNKTVTLGTKAEVASWNFFAGTVVRNASTKVVSNGMITYMKTMPPPYASNHTGYNSSSYCEN